MSPRYLRPSLSGEGVGQHTCEPSSSLEQSTKIYYLKWIDAQKMVWVLGSRSFMLAKGIDPLVGSENGYLCPSQSFSSINNDAYPNAMIDSNLFHLWCHI